MSTFPESDSHEDQTATPIYQHKNANLSQFLSLAYPNSSIIYPNKNPQLEDNPG
jgi:hypothetical protein